MGYTLEPHGLKNVVLVGCGGTGAFVAEGLCRLLPKNIGIALVDYDRVEPHNLLRQAFLREDLGGFKSEVLATRLSRNFGREIAYANIPFSNLMMGPLTNGRESTLTIGCVDNAAARQSIAEAFENHGYGWWIDAGNGFNSGQVLIGNVGKNGHFDGTMDAAKQVCYALPLPTVQRPDLLTVVPEEPSIDLDCAEAIELGEQSAVINQIMASLVLEFVRKLLTNSLGWMQAYVDMDVGQLTTTEVEPARVARMVGSRVNVLTSKSRQRNGFCNNCGRVH